MLLIPPQYQPDTHSRLRRRRLARGLRQEAD
jgi:hypothetical protein